MKEQLTQQHGEVCNLVKAEVARIDGKLGEHEGRLNTLEERVTGAGRPGESQK